MNSFISSTVIAAAILTGGGLVESNPAGATRTVAESPVVQQRQRVKVFVVYYVHKDSGVRIRHGHHRDRPAVEIWVVQLRGRGHRNVEIVIEEIYL